MQNADSSQFASAMPSLCGLSKVTVFSASARPLPSHQSAVSMEQQWPVTRITEITFMKCLIHLKCKVLFINILLNSCQCFLSVEGFQETSALLQNKRRRMLVLWSATSFVVCTHTQNTLTHMCFRHMLTMHTHPTNAQSETRYHPAFLFKQGNNQIGPNHPFRTHFEHCISLSNTCTPCFIMFLYMLKATQEWLRQPCQVGEEQIIKFIIIIISQHSNK